MIGRREGCGIVVLDSAASAHHAELREVEGGHEVRDLKTSNGTRVNDKLLGRPHRLRSGDRIQVGRTVFVFIAEQGAVDAVKKLFAQEHAPRRRSPEGTGPPPPTRFEGGAGHLLVVGGALLAAYLAWKLLAG